MNNAINHPPHYQACGPIGRELLITYMGIPDYELDLECIDFLERDHRYCNFHLGNAIKYLWRSGIKGAADEDLRKALWYLRRWQTPDRRNFVYLFLSMFGGARARVRFSQNIDRLADAIERRLSTGTPDRTAVTIGGMSMTIA